MTRLLTNRRSNLLLILPLALLLLASCDNGSPTPNPSAPPTQPATTKSHLVGVGPTALTATARRVDLHGNPTAYWPSPAGEGRVMISQGGESGQANIIMLDLSHDPAALLFSDTVKSALPIDDFAWANDGTAFAFSPVNAGGQSPFQSIHIYDIVAQTAVATTVDSDTNGALRPRWNSGGDALYFLAVKKSSTSVMRVGRDGKNPTTLFSVDSDATHRLYLYAPIGDGQRFVYALGNNQTPMQNSLYITDAQGGNPRSLGGDQLLSNIQMSPRGDTALLEHRFDPNFIPQNMTYTLSSLLPLDPARATQRTFLPTPVAPTNGGKQPIIAESGVATWSPDGDKLAYLAVHNVVSDVVRSLMVANADGSQPTEVYSSTGKSAWLAPASGSLQWAADDSITVSDGAGGLVIIQLAKKP